MMYETNCTEITITRWKELMKYARPCSYRLLVKRIKKEIPYLWHYKIFCVNGKYGIQV